MIKRIRVSFCLGSDSATSKVNAARPVSLITVLRMGKQRCRLAARYQRLLERIQGIHTLFGREQAAAGLAGRLIQ